MTPEQLRYHAMVIESDAVVTDLSWREVATEFRSHADALEELNVQRIEAENYRVKYAEMRARAERAEAELAKLKGHAEAMAESAELCHGITGLNAAAAYRTAYPKE